MQNTEVDIHMSVLLYICTESIDLLVLENIDWLIDWLFTILHVRTAQDFSLIWRRRHCRWRAAKFRPMICTQGFWAGRNLYCAIPAATRGLNFSVLIRMTSPFSRLLRHTRWCGGSILTLILTWVLEKIFFSMKWLRYQRVISLKIQVRNTNQRNKWANTDPRI
jgi:hypothetical protein